MSERSALNAVFEGPHHEPCPIAWPRRGVARQHRVAGRRSGHVIRTARPRGNGSRSACAGDRNRRGIVPAGRGSGSSPAPQQPAQAALRNVADSDPDDPKLAGTFTGRVLGPDADPVAGAKIFIVPDDPKLKAIGPVRALTDANGRFSFDAPDMTFRSLDGLPAQRQGLLFATHEGYAADWMTTWGHHPEPSRAFPTPVRQAEYTLRLAKNDVTIHGTLLDPEGEPLAGARVRLTALMVPRKFDLNAHLERESHASLMNSIDYERGLTRPKLLPGATVEAFTDAAGRFVLSGLGRDRLAVLEVSAPTIVVTTLTVMTRSAATSKRGSTRTATPPKRSGRGLHPSTEARPHVDGYRPGSRHPQGHPRHVGRSSR